MNIHTTVERRGRPDVFADKFKLAATLNASKNGEKVSRFVTDKLVARGYVKQGEKVRTGKPGQPAFTFVLTPKGNTYVNFSRNWKKA